MELVHGKTYIDGTGAKVRVRLLARNGGEFPFIGDNHCRYMADGAYIDRDPAHACLRRLDLIKEVPAN